MCGCFTNTLTGAEICRSRIGRDTFNRGLSDRLYVRDRTTELQKLEQHEIPTVAADFLTEIDKYRRPLFRVPAI